MASQGTVDVHFLLSQEGIASSFLGNLAAGELINLARTNSVIRADLHGFDEPHLETKPVTTGVRHEVQIGHHQTIRWRKLKTSAPYECSSSTHTKGTDVKPCRYCSRLICGACMTRDSFKNPGEKTFQNRCRSFCESCWTSGNRHQRQKITDDCGCHRETKKGQLQVDQAEEVAKNCECTNRNDGWVCLECKHLQNKVWLTDKCFGEGCSNSLDSAAERRKICMWCDKPLPITATRENPHVYKQKVVDAMAREAASRQADMELHSLQRQMRLRMSRREFRGDDAVVNNIMADVPELMRHLDTVNYKQLLGSDAGPASSQIYESKRGRWQYSREFLMTFQNRCHHVSLPRYVKEATRDSRFPEYRTNQQLQFQKDLSRRPSKSVLDREDFQAYIMLMRHAEGRSIRYIQDMIFKKHGVWESRDRYREIIVQREIEDDLKSSRARLRQQDRSRYWQDLGSAQFAAVGDFNETPDSSSETPGAKPEPSYLADVSLSPKHDQKANLGENSTDASVRTDLAEGSISRQDSSLYRSPSIEIRQALATGTLFPHPIEGPKGKAVDTKTQDQAMDDSDADDEVYHDMWYEDTAIPHNQDISSARNKQSIQLPQDHSVGEAVMPTSDPTNDNTLDELIAAQEAFQERCNGTLYEDMDPEDLELLISLHEAARQESEDMENESISRGKAPVYYA